MMLQAVGSVRPNRFWRPAVNLSDVNSTKYQSVFLTLLYVFSFYHGLLHGIGLLLLCAFLELGGDETIPALCTVLRIDTAENDKDFD